jgi:hypothetical protein
MGNNLRAFFAHPFRSDMDWKNWFLFVGLVFVAVILWSTIIIKLKEVTE